MSLPDLDPFTLRWLADEHTWLADQEAEVAHWTRFGGVRVRTVGQAERVHRATAKRLRGRATRMEKRRGGGA